MMSAASNLKRVTLELGGNDAAIVLPDVHVEKIVPELFWAAFRNTGQVCVAAKRLFVHSAIYDAVAKGLVDGLIEYTNAQTISTRRQVGVIRCS